MTSQETKEINSFLENRNRYSFYWIGLTDLKTEGEFVWASNGLKPNYTNWANEEPNGGMIEDCVNLNYAYQKRTWNDLSCDASDVLALCERGLSSNLPFFLI